MNYPSNAMINNQEKDRINFNNKFHAQKYYTIPKINIFKKSENNLNFQKKSYTPQTSYTPQNSSQDNSLSQQSITGNKRSCDLYITGSSSKSSKELRYQNDFNKKSKNSEESVRDVSTPNVAPLPSDDSRLASLNSQRNLNSQRSISSLQTDSSNTKLKGRIMNTSQHERRLENQSKVQETSDPSPDSPENTKSWSRSQTREQQLEIMKYWLDKYHKKNRFDPAISDLTSGKPWNEIEGKLLSRFMPVFKRYLLDNGISSRTSEFYFLFFTALQDKHKIANNIFPDEILQSDD